MLIPSIDLMGGRIVQLEQGERVVMESADVDEWVGRFERFPIVQLVDLDAAMGKGDNDRLVRDLCSRLPCQVGGGVRGVDRARTLREAGASRIVVGSALYADDGVDRRRAREFREVLGREAFVAAIDARGGRVAIHGWQTTLDITPEAAAAALDPFCGTFLYTHVDTEGLLGGFPVDRLESLREATSRPLIVAGGIRSLEEVSTLDAMGVDAVVGMAIYRGFIKV
jgi:phosphoribosylformimino-5-aminoimidazole carboxamide ribotide isomerase